MWINNIKECLSPHNIIPSFTDKGGVDEMLGAGGVLGRLPAPLSIAELSFGMFFISWTCPSHLLKTETLFRTLWVVINALTDRLHPRIFTFVLQHQSSLLIPYLCSIKTKGFAAP
jgi:hypothetical protein